MAFEGMRVLSLESRRGEEIAKLIRNQGGDPTVVPSMREVPVQDSSEVYVFAERLFAGEFDMLVLLTGVGTRQMAATLSKKYPPEAYPNALRRLTVVPRGPKPIAVLREWGVPYQVTVPEPNTWREILQATDGRSERCIAIQEYGRPSPELVEGFRARGAEVSTVRIYQWDLPENVEPLRDAVRRLGRGEFQVAMFTTSIQVPHLLRIADESGIDAVGALRKTVVASVGPTTSETLEEFGITPDLVPSHPKMGFLVKETAEQAAEIWRKKTTSG
jgi:uroporphyrinogen-III synthase